MFSKHSNVIMADGHVVSKETSSIFNIFTKLVNNNGSVEKSCVLLIDALKWDDRKIRSSSSIEYTSKRLVRGLASSDCKRQCVLFATLTAALQNDAVTVSDVITALNSEVKNNGPSRSEHGVSLTITVLTCGAIIKSGQFLNVSLDIQLDVVRRLVTFGQQKQYLRNAVSAFFVELLKSTKKSTFKAVVWPIVKEETERQSNLEDEWYAVLFLSAWSFPKLTDKFITERFGSKQKFCELVILRCAYYPTVVQEAILELLLMAMSSQSRELIRVWQILIEHEHKMTPKWSLFLIVFCRKILNAIDDPSVCLQIVRPEIIQAVLISGKKELKGDVEFSRSCKGLLEVLVARLTAIDVDKSISLQMLKIFLFKGDLNFDRKTKTKTVQMMIDNLNARGIKDFLTDVKGIIAGVSNKSDNSEWLPRERQFLLSMLGRLIFHSTLQKEPEFVLNTVMFLFNTGFLTSEKISSELRKQAKDVFFKVIELPNFKMDAAAALLNDVITYVDTKSPQLHNEFSETVLSEWKTVLAANTELQKSNQDKKVIALRLLLLHMGLLLFRDAELATSTVQDLLQCYKRIEKNKCKIKAVDTEEPHWVEVIVDLLLALLSRENKLLRHVVSSVFPSMSPHLTPTALQQIVDALDPNSNSDILGHTDSDVSDGGEDESGEDDGDDLDDTDSDLEDIETERETVNDKLRMAVRNALGYSAALTDDESVDMDEMNEDEERRLNESLANAFRMFRASKTSKKKQSKDDEARTHFRARVLDLVEIIVSTNPTLGACLDLISPLLTLLEFAIKDPHQKPLQNRIEGVLRKLCVNKKFRSMEEISLKNIIDVFKGVFERDVSGLVSTEMSSIITECSGFLVRASQLFSPSSDDGSLENIFVDLLNRLFMNNDRKVPFGIFQASLRMLWDGNWTIVEHIMTLLVDQDLKVFKKMKLLCLVETFYKNDRLQSTATDDRKTALCTAESRFVKKLSKYLAESNESVSKSKLLSSFYSRLLQLVLLAVASLNKYRKDCPPIPKWKRIVKQFLLCPDLFQHQKTKCKLLHLAQLYNISVSTVPQKENVTKPSLITEEEDCTLSSPEKKRKRKVSTEMSSADDDVLEEKRGKKKRSSKQVRQLAKESRDLREAASSQGLMDISFDSVALQALQEEGDESSSPGLGDGVRKDRGKKKKTACIKLK